MPLSRNLWAARSGANALIASGSVVNDTYQEYVGRVEGQVALDWQAEKPASLFSDAPLTAEIDETEQLTARFSDQLWVDYTTQRNADQITLTINNVVRASDATRLAWGGTEGAGRNLPAVVVDLAGEAADLDTQYRAFIRPIKPCPSPEVEFYLRENSRFRAGLGIEAKP